MEFNIKTSAFTAREMQIIRVFFNVSSTVSADEIYDLGDGFLLEEDYVEHVIGDKLWPVQNGFIVNSLLAEENQLFLFQRTQEGLLSALLQLVNPEE